MITKFLDPKNDFAFRQVFGKEKNKDILIHFLNVVLAHTHVGKIVGLQFLERARDPAIAARKQSLVDVSCQDQAGNQYIIELQIGGEPGFEKRAQYYAAKRYTEQQQEVIFIAITDYVVFPEQAAVKSALILVEEREQGAALQHMYFMYIELPKFTKRVRELTSELDYWCYYLKYAPMTSLADYEQLIAHISSIDRAYQASDPYYWSEAELNTYEEVDKRDRDNAAALHYKLEEAAQRGMKQGEQKGMEKGRAEEKLAIAKQMLFQLGLDLATVQKATGLARAALEALQAAGK